MKQAYIKKGLWTILFLVICLPMLQQCFNLCAVEPLVGNYEVAGNVEISRQSWWDGSYQEGKNKYLNDNMGFRADLGRLNIQLDFTLFNELPGTSPGKNEYLFFRDYVIAARGYDFLGYERIRETVTKMTYLQSIYEKKGKTFLMVFAPSKTTYWQEYMPAMREYSEHRTTNYEIYTRLCDSLNVESIDFDKYFLALKPTAKEAMFTKQGIHWSLYGAMYAVDSMIKYLERKRNIDLPDPEWSTYERTDIARDPDNDMGWMANLMYPIKETYAYHNIKFGVDTTGPKPSAIYVGDSFMWPLEKDSLLKHTHSSWEVWYYFNTVFTARSMRDEEEEKPIANYDWKAKLDSADCLVMVFVAPNYKDLNRFVDSAYSYYKSKEISH